MKRKYLILLLLGAVSCSQEAVNEHNTSEIVLPNTTDKKELLTRLEFEQTAIDFGEITDTSVVMGEFEFQNVGQHPAILRQVHPSCGCTVPEYDRGEIQPGATSMIAVKFTPNSVEAGTQVLQQSHVKLIGNFKDTIYLKVSAIVGN